MVFGQDMALLSCMTIMIEINNELLRFISQQFPHKLNTIGEITSKTLDVSTIDPFDSPANNFNKIKQCLMDNYLYILNWLSR